jgi:uncharacterized protein (DUF1800 family)
MESQNQSRRRFLKVSGATAAVGAAVSLGVGESVSADSGLGRLPALFPPRDRSLLPSGTLPPLGFRVFHKLGFGPKAGDIDAFNALGATDDERLAAWLEQQLFPTNDDPEVDSRINGNTNFITLDKTLTEMWVDHERYEGPRAFQARIRPLYETESLTLTRMLHSQWQLREVLADFWHNHFNVDAEETGVRSTMTEYDRAVIRPFIFGNFRAMLEANARSTAMLFYLDNRVNSTPNPNENYGRELLELHTLGAVENYYGFIPPDQVPTNVDGQPAGYVEADVLEIARLLTGFGVNDGADDAPDTGTFLYRPERHDDGTKTVVGLEIPGSGESELAVVLDHLASHRGTAEFICWKLAVRLIGDGFNASDALIQSAADIFQDNWQESNQLELVYRSLILSQEFNTRWADKAKRPIETIMASLRAAGSSYTFEPRQRDDIPLVADRNGLFNAFNDTGQALFVFEPPTGYPEDRGIWQGAGPLIQSWRAITRFIREDDADNVLFANVAETTNNLLPLAERTPNLIVDFWLNRILGFEIAAGKRDVMVNFVAQGGDPDAEISADTDNITNDSDYQRRIRGLVELITMSPEYMSR